MFAQLQPLNAKSEPILLSVALDIYTNENIGNDVSIQECLKLPSKQVVFKCLWSNNLKRKD